MKVLITGGLGYVGISISPVLNRFYDLRITHWKNPENEIPYEFMKCDIRNKEEVEKVVEGVDVIVHLAAKGAKNPDTVPYKEAIEVNILGTANLLESAEKFKIKKFIFTSTVHVYGLYYQGVIPEYFPIDEEHPTKPSCPYGITKFMAEKLIENFCRMKNIPAAILRLGLTIRRGFNLESFINEGRPDGLFQYIDVRDVAYAIKLLIDKDFEGCHTFNLVAKDNSLSWKIKTIDLIKKFFPEVKYDEKFYSENEYASLFKTEKIREFVGFEEKFPLSRLIKWINEGKKGDYFEELE